MTQGTRWMPSPRELILRPNDVHVWRVSLDPAPDILRRLEVWLTNDERSRAAKFRFVRDQHRFVVGRGILRELLGNYLNIPPNVLEFCYGIVGKPALSTNGVQSPIRFNLSHSNSLAVLAFTRGRDIGIDVEEIRPEFAEDDIAERYFSALELGRLRAMPPAKRVERFFRCWTRKEAYIKARGLGLQIPLDSFSVSLGSGDRVIIESQDAHRWSVRSFNPTAGFVGAIVCEGQGWRARYWDYSTRD